MNKTIKVGVVKASYKVSLGHQDYISGCGSYDNRPKRKRTRQTTKEAWKKDNE